MTRDEHRAECLTAIKDRLEWHGVDQEIIHVVATDVLDSLHGIARVNPIEATEEMIEAGADMMFDFGFVSEGKRRAAVRIFDAMSAAGDLTNPQEKKP